MENITDETLANIMANAETIASVGLTNRPGDRDYEVASYQQSQGYLVVPVNPQIDSALGEPAVKSVQDIDDDVDIVNVFSHGFEVDNAVDAAISKGAKVLWLQPGVHNNKARQRAEQAGMTVVENRCFEREHRRLLSDKPM